MKNIFAYMALAAAVTFAASCSREAAGPEFKGEDAISLSLVYEAPVTKSDAPGLESAVTSVEYFFYDVNGTLLYRKYDSSPELTENKYSVSLVVGEGVLASKSYNDFFPNGADCQFFAVFNYPEEIGDNTLENVKKKAVSNTFSYNVPDANGDPHWHVTQDSDVDLGYEKYFVMTGSATLSPNPAGITGTVDMRRIAAKITFVVKVAQSKTITEGSKTDVWTPMLTNNNPRIYLSNAVANALIGGADIKDKTAGTAPIFPEKLTQFNYEPDVLDFDGGYTSTSPFYYTFPLDWEAGDDSEIYCKLIIPWKMVRTESGVVTYSTERELYYKVLFPETEIVANKHYVYTINADFLGREGEEPTITITAEKAIVLPWTISNDVNPVISAAKYLSVERGEVTMTDGVVTKGTPDIIYTSGTTITYSASDPVTLVVKNIYQKNLSTGNNEYLIQNGSIQSATLTSRNNRNGNPRIAQEVQWTAPYVNSWITPDDPNHLFVLNHELNSNLLSKNMDVTPYIYEIELHLGAPGSDTYNNASYTKTVQIIQYPQVYVIEDPNRSGSNDGYVFLNTYDRNSQFTTDGYYTILDTDYSNYDYLGGVHGLNGTNINPNMYVLVISVSNDYTIGDPRSTDVSNPSFTYNGYSSWNRTRAFNGSWNSAPWTQGGNHALSFYYPASNDDYTKNMIAPKIRIASSYGVTLPIDQTKAIARCAAYQEDGIPAGRWRLPTMAEVKYISTLSTLNRIPYLFGNTGSGDSAYWTANGQIIVNNSQNNRYAGEPNNQHPAQSSVYIRCVYDEWYWGDAVTEDGTAARPVSASTFTWGDKQR